jgi:hypothetical protein
MIQLKDGSTCTGTDVFRLLGMQYYYQQTIRIRMSSCCLETGSIYTRKLEQLLCGDYPHLQCLDVRMNPKLDAEGLLRALLRACYPGPPLQQLYLGRTQTGCTVSSAQALTDVLNEWKELTLLDLSGTLVLQNHTLVRKAIYNHSSLFPLFAGIMNWETAMELIQYYPVSLQHLRIRVNVLLTRDNFCKCMNDVVKSMIARHAQPGRMLKTFIIRFSPLSPEWCVKKWNGLFRPTETNHDPKHK